MEYTVKALAELSGVTPRTLRWYDRVGLLKPARFSEAGYRFYGPAEVNRLQQILFYRELGFSLENIADILNDPAFDAQAALQGHLRALREKREQLDALILTVEQTILNEKGELNMTDKEKFEAFKSKQVEENEKIYGKEAREAYGDEEVEASNRNMMAMTQEEYERWQALDRQIKEGLEAAVKAGEDPAGSEGQRLAELHREWLAFTMKPYDPKRHRGIAELYVLDERFTAYYDSKVPGCAQFLRDSIIIYTE